MKKHYKFAVVLFFSALSAWLLSPIDNFPFLGISIFFLTFNGIVAIFKKEKNLFHFVLFLINTVLAVFIMFRSNPFLIFLDIVTIFYLGSFITLADTKKYSFMLAEVIFAPLIVFFESLLTRNTFYSLKDLRLGRGKNNKESTENGKDLRLGEIFGGIAITAIILMVILPLLSYSNPFFKELIDIDILRWFEDLFSFETVFRGIVFLVLMFFTPKLISRAGADKIEGSAQENIGNDAEAKTQKYLNNANLKPNLRLLIPKFTTILVLVAFFITQIQLYTATPEVLEAMNYSNSRQTREVFAHLAIVALIMLILIYQDSSKEIKHKISTYILAIETFFLTGVAFRSDYEYIMNWGFTHKRLYGMVFIIWVIGTAFFTLHKYISDHSEKNFFQKLIVYTATLLIAVNIANFDYLIFHYAKSSTQEGIDYGYLTFNLSTDAHALEYLYQASLKDDKILLNYGGLVINRIEALKREYQSQKFDYQAFNFSRYTEYQRVKQLDTNIIEKKIEAEFERRRQENEMYPYVLEQNLESVNGDIKFEDEIVFEPKAQDEIIVR